MAVQEMMGGGGVGGVVAAGTVPRETRTEASDTPHPSFLRSKTVRLTASQLLGS